MTDVACFCGCFYWFDDGAGTCPTCGEIAMVMSASTGRSEQRTAVTCEDWQNGRAAVQSFRDSGRELVSDLLAGVGVASVPACDSRTGQERRG